MKQAIEISPKQKVRPMENVLIQDLVEESVLLDLENEEYFGLDSVGKRMLSSLEESESTESAYQLLLEEFEVEPEQLRQDLQDFISKMVGYGLVEITSS